MPIYWRDQCYHCKNRNNCEYKQKVKKYISDLGQVNDSQIYGSLQWWCDYFICDESTIQEQLRGVVEVIDGLDY